MLLGKQPDPGAEAVDAFTLDWRSDTFFFLRFLLSVY